MTLDYDAIIIGTGQAGPPLAARLSAAGHKVAVIERQSFGGTCVNTGCIPTKTMVASAYAANLARRGAEYGVVPTGPVTVDMARVKARKDGVVGKSTHGVETWVRTLEHGTVHLGHARFEGPDTVRVNDTLLRARKIFINVGGRAATPPMPGLEQVNYLTNAGMMRVDTLPRHLLVVGGSYIGLEFGQMFRRFGAEVTIVEKGASLIGREDPDISDAVREILEAEGIAIRTGAECIRFARAGEDVLVGVDCHEGSPEVLGSHVLLAVGRTPNTDDLGLDAAGVQTDARGYVQVDDRLRTNVDGIWAMGDCNGRGAFTHTAYNDFEIVADNLLDGADRKVTDRIPAYALYIDPPLGRVGMGEAEAKKAGHRIEVGRRPMTRVGRAVEKDETLGFMKLVSHADTGRILGGAILGTSGDEAIHGVLDLMVKQGTATDLAHAVHIHPTVSELLPTIAGERKPA